ncbi:MAG: phosphatase PAP2 family protein [Cytophagales bacterium]|nr:MAG: phosphatase PAP2 family protein [Cytophagales bacterium]
MLEFLDQTDKTIFLLLNGLHQDWLDLPMQTITSTSAWIPLYILIVIFLFWKFKKFALVFLVAVGLCIAAADQFTSSFMKPTFQRPRPCYDEQISAKVYNYVGCGGQYGFASSHAANTFALAMLCWLVGRNLPEKKKIGVFMFAWASLVSYSRIYVGVHYLGDIIAGAFVGISVAYLIFLLFQKFKLKPFLPH